MKNETMNANMMTCKTIADTLEQIVNGDLWRCPACGEYIADTNWSEYLGDEDKDVRKCSFCGDETDPYEWEQVTIMDYFCDVLDVEYRIGADRKYRSVRLMIAYGGPNIYVDTAEKAVVLYWGTERAKYPISTDVVNAIDEIWNDAYNV